MRTLALVLFGCVLILFGGVIDLAAAPKLYLLQPAVGELTISVDPTLHQKFGLSYPVTYQLSIPAGSSGLRVYHKHQAVATWTQLPTRNPSDFFNGEEAVRFDYGAAAAYISVTFDASTEDIYLRIVDAGDQPVTTQFQSICRYYDNREAAVVATGDDWTDDSNGAFITATHTLRSYHLPMTTGVITGGCSPATWQAIQHQLDSGYVEVASHSRTHAALPYPDPSAEILGSRQDLLANLTLPPYFRRGTTSYVLSWVYPYGGVVVFDSLVAQAGYLVPRLASGTAGYFASWDTALQKYQPDGVTLEMGPLWGGISDVTVLNSRFDEALTNGRIYHVMMHPGVLSSTNEWSKEYVPGHLSYISNRTNVWYANFGTLYLYHVLQDPEVGSIEVLSGPPVITQQPAARTVTVGQTAVFSVTAVGNLPLNYQWQKNGSNIGGATSAGYTTPATVAADSGASFRCVISNGLGSVTSQAVFLHVTASSVVPNILTNADFEGGMSRWEFYSNGTAAASITSPGASGSTGAALVNVTEEGTNVQLYQYGITLEPSTSYTVSFDAYSNTGHDVDVALGQHVAPYTNYGLPVHHFDVTNSWQTFQFTFTTSGFTGTVSDARLMLWLAPYDAAGDQYRFDNVVLAKTSDLTPRIVTQPMGATVQARLTATFSVVANGLTPLTYQWRKDGSDITGATSATYTTPAVTSADSGASYRCRVANGVGSVFSNRAQLLVFTPRPPVVVAEPRDTTVLEGQRVSFSVALTGTRPLVYHWQKDGADILEAHDSVYVISACTRADSGARFRCWVANVDGRDTSYAARLSVLPAQLHLNPTVFLEGPYDPATTTMRNTLRTSGVLAAEFPGMAIPDSAVDSVNVEIRDSTSGVASSFRRLAPAWLLSNGTLRGFTDTTQIGVAFDAPAGNYYVVVHHRNHLAIMSLATVALNGAPVAYDFTTSIDAAYGTDPMKSLVGSRFGMFAGDVNGNGQLKYNLAGNDRALILARVGGTNINATVAGYYNEDVNLDGVVKYNLSSNDRAIILQNIGGSSINATKSTQVPN